MKAIVVTKAGGPEQLLYEEYPIPQLAPDQVLVKTKAIGINFIDIYFRKGIYKIDKYPYIPGKEASGDVAAVGEEVKNVAVGERVVFCKAITGTYAEYAVVNADQVVKIPEQMDYEIAAASMLQGLTAYYLSHLTIKLNANDTVLIHAGAGGVALLLIQMAKFLGAKVITTVSSEAKEKLAKSVGADHTIIYSQFSFQEIVMNLTNGKGVNVVYDAVGKDTFNDSLNSLAVRGLLVSYGQASGPIAPIEINQLATKSLYITRPSLFDYTATREELVSMSNALFDYILNKGLQVEIGQHYQLSNAGQAHRDLEHRRTVGKSILLPE
jgi:NADPH:quinone reductase